MDFTGHAVHTAAAQGWDRLRNGSLMRAAAEAGFEVLVTVDQNLRYQQSPTALPIAVVVLCAASNDIESLRALVPSTLNALTAIKPGELVEVRAPQ